MTAGLTDRLRKKCQRFGEDFAAGRISEMTSRFYHADAVMEGRELPAEKGHQAIARIFAEAREVYSALAIELDSVTQIGDVAFGNFTNRNSIIGGGEDIHRGLMVWVRVNEEWLVARDFFFADGDPLFNSVPHYPLGGTIASPPRSRRG